MWPFSPGTIKKRKSTPRFSRQTNRLRLEMLEHRHLLSAGALDPTFGVSGIVSAPAVGVAGMAIQPGDQKIVTAGTVYTSSSVLDDFAAARYLPNGSLDTSFGTGGKVVTDISKGWDEASATALQQDGKILIAGRHSPKANSGVNWDMALVRYTASGKLDTTFGSGGEVTTSFSKNSQEQATAVAVQADGKIVIAGVVQHSTIDFALARFNTNGTLDTTFGTGGRLRIHFASGVIQTPTYGTAQLVVQPDGKLVVAGDVGDPTEVRSVGINRFGVANERSRTSKV